MRSYLEILNELKETVDTDCIPEDDKKEIDNTLNKLFDLLWNYSD